MAFVIDASVVLAWMLPDEQSDRAEAVISRVAADQAFAPSLLLLEVGNALLQAQRRKRIARSMRAELLEAFTALPLMLEPISAASMMEAGHIAEAHSLSLYDGVYVALAASRNCRLATFDRRLARAAAAVGVELIGAG